ncbi:UDP-glycosyltransferase UGT5 [Drosophila ananassae]|uniref:UDP-glycosyltransferase UGT5 n=1 Tax=Drosophila ananassae TaxID=7217 RepID=UPI0013A5CC3F|nr:UDP-glycosyltransferase UGT5 [Drosophila ananassae]
MKFIYILHVWVLSLVSLSHLGTGARILAAFFCPARSHFMMTHAIIRELVKRGNEVTFITPVSMGKEELGPNYKEILFAPYDSWNDIRETTKISSAMELTDLPIFDFFRMVYTMGIHSTDFAFEQPEIQAVINEKNQIGKYDLLITEQFFNEGALILGHLYQIPIVTLSMSGYANYLSQLVGIVSPWSYVPHKWMAYTDRMTLWERIGNAFVSGSEDLYREFKYYPKQDAILRKHFSNLLARVPTIKELERNISAILLNTYLPLASPRPTSFNMIQVGGVHIESPKELPKDLQEFLDEATHGAIYFSLGSQVRSAELRPEKLKIFLKVFDSLKQRVLWKFENETLPELPPNVKVQRWLPQGDVLAHPNVKVFIAHGGLFGIQEAVYHGVPVLGMPVYGDQSLNLQRGKSLGCALVLDYRRLSEDELRSSLIELLENPQYRSNMKEASRVYRNRPLSAMDTAIYWIEYVITHRGAPYLVANGVHLPWYQFYLLDVIGVVFFIAFVTIFVLTFLCRKSLSLNLIKSRKNLSQKKYKKN